MSKKKRKIKTVVKRIYIKPSEDDYKKQREEVKGEITELEKRREAAPSGIKGFFQRASINQAINQRKKFIVSGRQLTAIKQQTAILNAQIGAEKAKNELRDLKKKREVDFDSLNSFGGKKQIKLEDLY